MVTIYESIEEQVKDLFQELDGAAVMAKIGWFYDIPFEPYVDDLHQKCEDMINAIFPLEADPPSKL